MRKHIDSNGGVFHRSEAMPKRLQHIACWYLVKNIEETYPKHTVQQNKKVNVKVGRGKQLRSYFLFSLVRGYQNYRHELLSTVDY